MSNAVNRPRILVVIRWPVGGIRTWCRYVYRNAAFAGYDIEILLPMMEEAVALRDDLDGTGIKVTLIPYDDSVMSFGLKVARRIRAGRYALVHSHGFTSGVLSMVPCKLLGVPHLLTPHDVVLEDQYRDARGRVARLLLSLLLRSASWVQPVGEAAAQNLAEAFPRSFGRKRNVVVVRNGIDTARFLSATPEEVRQAYSIPADAIVVGFFGRFMAQKGFRYLVDAVSMHERGRAGGRQLVVLAVGGGGFRREEEESVGERGLKQNFRFIDFTPNVAALLKAVDVVAMPSLWEACPLLPMEALTAGTPIVVSNWSACVEIARDTPARVVPMRDAAALLDAILAMIEPRMRIASASFSPTAAARFDIASTIQGIADLYERILAPDRSSTSSAS